MSWNPSPTIGSANWQGNAPLVTKNQLLSTSIGLENLLGLSTISSFQALFVSEFISTPLLFVSDIRGYPQLLSANTATFNLVNVSSIGFKAPDIGPLVDVNVDFNLGDFVQGALIGTGALLFETAVGIGVGAGATFIGIGNGIAAMINSKDPVNNPTYINTNNYEVLGGSTQLQVSTLGDAYPVYSSIMRYVSSVSPNQIPGAPMFTSTLFYPGQICIRSISDPTPLVTAIPGYQGSTIQQFGEWVPLEGLEPKNIIADSVSSIFISTQNLSADYSYTTLAEAFAGQFSNLDVRQNMYLEYNAPLAFNTGSVNSAAFVGDLNRLYCYNTTGWIFSGASQTEMASLYVGGNANESILNVSSINSGGFIQANQGYFSSLTVNSLTILSSICTIQNITACNILSTSIIESYLVSTINLQAQYVAPFTFSSLLGNPTGPFDITKIDNVVSTTYVQVSSLTQNMMFYSLNESIQDEAIFNIGDAPLGVVYKVTPQNIQQWNSTIIYWTGLNPGGLDFGWVGQWGVTPGDLGGAAPNGATLDMWIDPNNANGGTGPFYITEQSNQSYPAGVSTFFQVVPGGGQVNPNTYKFRFTLPPIVNGSRSGWWQMSNGFIPYESSNNNTFQMYQDINDTYIQGTDRLHIVAGDILMDGAVTFQQFNTCNINTLAVNTSNLFGINSFLSSISTANVQATNIIASNVVVNPVTGGFDAFYYKSTISWNDPPSQVTPLQMTFKNDSPDFLPIFNLLGPFQGFNYFNSYNVGQWYNSVWTNAISVASQLGPPVVILGDLQTPLGPPYSGFFYLNNSVAQAMTIYTITSAGKTTLGVCQGNTFMRVQTSDGVNWTLTPNIPNPQGSGGSFSNVMTISQGYQQTNVVNTQNLSFQAPNVTYVTGNMGIYADQIRVNSHRYGTFAATGLPSYPIGIENNVYIDGNIAWTFSEGTLWQSDAQNVLYNITGQIFYDANSWIVQVIPSRFRTNNSEIVSYDVQPSLYGVAGGGYCWSYSRYILVNADVGGPGDNANNWNWFMAIPRNYCTYLI